jgi:hypothetical protein
MSSIKLTLVFASLALVLAFAVTPLPPTRQIPRSVPHGAATVNPARTAPMATVMATGDKLSASQIK